MSKRSYRFLVTGSGPAGYGARIYLESGSPYHTVLRSASHWGGADKRAELPDGTLFLGYEMSQGVADDLAATMQEETAERSAHARLMSADWWDLLQS